MRQKICDGNVDCPELDDQIQCGNFEVAIINHHFLNLILPFFLPPLSILFFLLFLFFLEVPSSLYQHIHTRGHTHNETRWLSIAFAPLPLSLEIPPRLTLTLTLSLPLLHRTIFLFVGKNILWKWTLYVNRSCRGINRTNIIHPLLSISKAMIKFLPTLA